MTSKEFFLDRVLQTFPADKKIKILEVGCGTAVYVPAILEKYPNAEYVGVEPIQESHKTALENTKQYKRAKVYFQLAYDEVEGLQPESFDVVVSFSVLEHVKDLEAFMKLCARYSAIGGVMVHRYDLGHALYPGSFKEKFHVWLGNTFPSILPERKFVRYVQLKEIDQLFADNGFSNLRHTHHQLPSVKRLEKTIANHDLPNDLFQDIYRWEFENAATFDQVESKVIEKIFPTVAVWGIKDRV